MEKRKKTGSLDDFLKRYLQDPRDAAAYLNDALSDEDPKIFLSALKDVAKAQKGGLSRVCEQANLSRESLYNTLKKAGPRLENFKALIEALSLRIHIELPQKTKPGRKKKRKTAAATV